MSWPMLSPRDTARFWSKVQSGEPTACWPWRAAVDKDGYGKFQVGPKGRQIHLRAHRVALYLVTGPFEGVVLHACDNTACCNPGHLSSGSQAENRVDCTIKGRNAVGDRNGARLHPERLARGASHGRSKLTDADVQRIRAEYVPRRTVSALAHEFGITRAYVHAVATGRCR